MTRNTIKNENVQDPIYASMTEGIKETLAEFGLFDSDQNNFDHKKDRFDYNLD